MPINPVMNGGPQAPLEGDTDSGFTGFRFATRAAADRSLGYTAISKLQGELAGGPMVSQKDAIAALKAENYDVDGIPADGMTQGALLARMSRASDIRQSENIAARSGIGTTTQIVAGFAGMLGDPINIAVAPLGVLSGAARVGLAGRAAIGAAEGAAFMGAYDAGQNAIGPSMGDPDITSHQILKDMMFGGALGGVMHAAFGPRPVAAPGGGDVTLDMIDRLGEKSGNYAKAHGISVDDVRSAKGALGRYQVMPDTALQYGATREQIAAGMLRDPTFNKMMAQRVLDDLNKRFPNDPEAVAIAYNAGPGVARRFIRSGRDYNVLPSETRAYAARVVGVPRQVRVDAAKMVVSQASLDAKIDGTKVVDEGMKDHFALRDEGESANIEAPKRDSIFTEDKDTDAQLQKMLKAELERRITTDTGEANLDPELAEHVTNDVQQAKDIHERLGNVVKAFHGTDADFKEFDVAKGGKFGAGDAHGAVFFTSNPEIASSYAKFAAKKPKIEVRDTPADGFEPVVSAVDGKTKYVKAGYEETFEGANVRPVKLSFTHPHEVDMKGEMYSQRVFGNALAKARIEGHDGVIFRNVNDDVSGKKLSTVYASFNPKEATTPHFGEFEPPEPPVIDGLPAEEHQKGVDAAVRCGMLKGGFS
jgi:hypothetical protein